jgi:2-oxo-4-hydroxy-4-carboxy-5-ureidoimidazoline decarboxylase
MSAAPHTLASLNEADADGFAQALDGVFEHAPWVARAAAGARPFTTVAALHDAMMAALHAAGPDAITAFLRGHPPLSTAALADAALTEHSRAEQAALGLASLGAAAPAFAAEQLAYAERFGFPFIICARHHTPRSVLRTLRLRAADTIEVERARALEEIAHITRLRLVARVTGPGAPRTTGHLSTHVLDTAAGRPAAGVRVVLLRDGVPCREAITDADGRTAPPLIADEPLRIGEHELQFHVGACFGGRGFYDVIPVRFAIEQPEGRYHIPLLLSPWSYTTYRGS